MRKIWIKVWLVVAIVFLLLIGKEVINISRTEAVIGEVHHQRQRQVEAGVEIFQGPLGRLMANKYLVASEKMTLRALEIVDVNIIFMAGHPNERAGIEEQERVGWLLIPLFAWGLVRVVSSSNEWFKNLVFLWLMMSIMWGIRFETIDERALVGVIIWVWGVVGVGSYDLVRKIFK